MRIAWLGVKQNRLELLIGLDETNMFLFEVIGKVVSGIGLHGVADSLLVLCVP